MLATTHVRNCRSFVLPVVIQTVPATSNDLRGYIVMHESTNWPAALSSS